MTKIAVFLFEGITDYEISFITHLLSVDAGMEVITLSYEDKLIKTSSGLTIKADKLVIDVLSESFDGIIIGGGWYGELSEELKLLIHKIDNDKKLIAGICGAGTVLLAKSGILNNKKYTTPIDGWTDKHIKIFGEENPFIKENFEDKRIVVDGNIITAKGIAFIDFAIEICDYFNLFEEEKERENFTTMIKG